MRKRGYRPDPPCFIPEGQEDRWPAVGVSGECVGFVPEGWSAQQMLNGEYRAAQQKLSEKPGKKK